jgi:hypothetical protein
MAFIAPVLAAVGGGSAIAGAITIGTAAVGAMSAAQQYKAGKQQQIEAKIAAQREGDAARQDEIERRRELVRSISTRNAFAGAQGADTGGSIAGMTRRDIRDNRNDLLIGRVNSAARMRALRSQGANAARIGGYNAASSLLDSATGLYAARGGGRAPGGAPSMGSVDYSGG